MSFKFYTPREEKSLTKSASQRFEEKMEAPDRKRGRHWSLQKNLPNHIKVSILESRANLEFCREMVKFGANHPNNNNKFVFLVVDILDGSYSPVGFSKLFDNLIEVFEFAKSIGREKVKIKGIVYEVQNELDKEAARIVAEESTKNNYIKFGYWKQRD